MYPMYEIEFYETEGGDKPVEIFLDSLPTKLNAKALRDIDLLEEKGRELTGPFVEYLGDKLFELRTKFSSDIVRVFYFFFDGDKIILTSGILKKSTKAPPEEIKRARRYMADYERRHAK